MGSQGYGAPMHVGILSINIYFHSLLLSMKYFDFFRWTTWNTLRGKLRSRVKNCGCWNHPESVITLVTG